MLSAMGRERQRVEGRGDGGAWKGPSRPAWLMSYVAGIGQDKGGEHAGPAWRGVVTRVGLQH